MTDVKVERKATLSRAEAAVWLHALSSAFAKGGEVTLPIGDGTVALNLPEQVEAEFEVEVEGDEVEVEVEFTWSTAARIPKQASAGPDETAEDVGPMP